MKVVAWIIGLPIAIFLFMLMLGAGIKVGESYSPAPARTDKQKFTYAASECWKEYERKSLAPDEKRAIASMCEGLEARAKEQ